jgi:thiol:disulfide interchange protein DsbA
MDRYSIRLPILIAIVVFLVVGTSAARAADAFVEGTHFSRLTPAVPTSTPAGVVEVVEVFSYGCVGCFQAQPAVKKLKASLPAQCRLVYVPASFIPSEAWPMFQRAYLTAQALGIADRTHDVVFDAIWRTGEIPLLDPTMRRMRNPLPTIDAAAQFYSRHAGVSVADFLTASKSFAVETRIGQSERLVRAYRADSTPTFVVNGKWKVESRALRTYDDLVQIVLFLVAKEMRSG